MVETLDQVYRWHIDLFGIQLPTNFSKRHLHRICLSESSRLAIWRPGKATSHIVSDDPIVVEVGKAQRFVFVAFGPASNMVCVVDVDRSPKSGLHMKISCGRGRKDKNIEEISDLIAKNADEEEFGWERIPERSPIWHALPRETKIKSLVGQ